MSSKKLGIARLSKGGKRFEIMVNIEKAWRVKGGETVNIREIVESPHIYYDARKGLKASPEDLREVFGTEDVLKVAEVIIKQGELQLSAEQRRELIDMKKKQIIDFIWRNAVDPRTGAPHPHKRIEIALEEVGFPVDPFRPVEVQVQEAIKALSKILPLKIARALVAVRIPSQYSGKTYGVLSKIGKILRSEYASDGSWLAELEIPAGMTESLIEQVNSLTKGEGEVKIITIGG
ncbi:MAG: ribosome assembly factor SBDS [Thermofilaceae archaeon]|nr:ribosome assembly factor SBDS [Thermofilaceae archaeon]MCX8181031.1 ribosome assembly factor SBDS [Thermofilaceae archaeon]MDW8004512.1 ribosome assembly factor SBDS [Thermofilaceae archaeon]